MTYAGRNQYFLGILFLLICAFPSCKTSEGLTTEDVYHCQGNNPFWKADINKDEIIFEITGKEKRAFPAVSAVESDGLKIFVTFLKEGDEKIWLKIKIKEGICQTSSAGKKFPYQVEVEIGDDNYYGCGELK